MSPHAFRNYTKIDAVNWSTLKEMRRSPLHYRHRLTTPREDTAALRKGRACHTAVFEPDRFLLDYTLFTHENKGGKVVRSGKVWDEFEANALASGKTILTPQEYAKALAVRDAVRANPLAMKYLAAGSAEQTIRWIDDETGIPCKGRIDFVSESSPAIVDLKTSATIEYGKFASTAYRLGYHCQLGFYEWGARMSLGFRGPVIVIAVEANSPNDVAVFEYNPDCIEAGLAEARAMLTKLSFHREKDTWPGQYAEEQVLEFPAWATPDDDDINDLGLEAS